MNILKYFYPIIACLIFFNNHNIQADTIVLNNMTPHIHAGLSMAYLEDPESNFTISQVLSSNAETHWEKCNKAIPNYGYTDSSYWFKTAIYNDAEAKTLYYVEISYPVLDYIDAYIIRGDGDFQQLVMGDKFPFNQRPVKHKNFVFPVKLKASEKVRLIFKIKTESSMQIPVSLYQEAEFLNLTQYNATGFGIYYGIMMIMVIYNLFIYFTVREKEYLYYVLYVSNILIFIASLNGASYQYLWPNSIWWNDEAIVFCLSAGTFFGILFGRAFLLLPKTMPRTDLFCLCVIFLTGLLMPVSFFIPYKFGILSAILLGVIAIGTAFFAGLARLMDGYTSAKYYLIAWISILAGGVILALNKFAIIPHNFFTEHLIQIGTGLEVTLLSFALADRLNMMKKEILESEKKARIADQRALDIQKKATATLEKKVTERTEELNTTLQQVETANNHIMSSLRYAGLIQLSILPNQVKVDEWLPSSFVFWRPRDIVGGDFYYIDKIDEKYIIVVADCTGHGVPGAFMTLLSSSELKRIVKGEKCLIPSEILKKLHKRIRETLKQDTAHSFSDEGLDLAVCVIDPEENNLIFSGARQNLYYIQNEIISTIKGDKKSIGYSDSKTNDDFTNHTIPIEPGMQFYLPTDGVVDQMGEKTKRRYGSSRLKKTLLKNSPLTFEEQRKEFIASLDGFRGSRDYVDDVSLIAFSIKT